ncbi:hypothetical protein GALL_155240 [mine drainage metagenome]|uniref:Uncharacterized protein n=1 Tax=mine drainage metagenome TaxID=410659 RepID=A0A1J5S299_9ZZZZ
MSERTAVSSRSEKSAEADKPMATFKQRIR